MANPEHLEILLRGVEVWNKWREKHPSVPTNLSHADLRDANLDRANLSNTNLSDANLTTANLRVANLSETNLTRVDLSHADLKVANLSGANLTAAKLTAARLTDANLRDADLSDADLSEAYLVNANLINANLTDTNLTDANLTDANLISANFNGADLNRADLCNAQIGYTTFANVDLSTAMGLDNVSHVGPSTVGLDTLYKSAGNIPEVFLRGCGVPEDFITFIPSHFGIQQAIQFYSCFISYSTKDAEFTRRLYSRMRDEKLRVWFAPEDVKGGEKLYEQIERAIQIHDRLLIVLSESSLQSKWVMTEIRRARKVELKENRRKLFPIRLVDFDTLQSWECFDADTGEDLAVEVRQYFIPDFLNWKDHDAFEEAFNRLLRDLKAEEKKDNK